MTNTPYGSSFLAPDGRKIARLPIGVHMTCKGLDLAASMAKINSWTDMMFQPDRQPRIIGEFMGRDSLDNIHPGVAIAAELPAELAKRNQHILWSLPVSASDDANLGPTRFQRINSGEFDEDLLIFGRWINGTAAFARPFWESTSDYFEHSASTRAGLHYTHDEVRQAGSHVIQVVSSVAPDCRFGHDDWQRPYQSNGPDGEDTLVNTRDWMMDKSKWTTRGVDCYCGDVGATQPWNEYFARVTDFGGGISVPLGLDSWAADIKATGQIMSIGEFGVKGKTRTGFIRAVYDRVTKTYPDQGILIGYVCYFNQGTSLLTGADGAQAANLAEFKDTFGRLGDVRAY